MATRTVTRTTASLSYAVSVIFKSFRDNYYQVVRSNGLVEFKYYYFNINDSVLREYNTCSMLHRCCILDVAKVVKLEKAQSPMVERRVRGTTGDDVETDRRRGVSHGIREVS